MDTDYHAPVDSQKSKISLLYFIDYTFTSVPSTSVHVLYTIVHVVYELDNKIDGQMYTKGLSFQIKIFPIIAMFNNTVFFSIRVKILVK